MFEFNDTFFFSTAGSRNTLNSKSTIQFQSRVGYLVLRQEILNSIEGDCLTNFKTLVCTVTPSRKRLSLHMEATNIMIITNTSNPFSKAYRMHDSIWKQLLSQVSSWSRTQTVRRWIAKWLAIKGWGLFALLWNPMQWKNELAKSLLELNKLDYASCFGTHN